MKKKVLFVCLGNICRSPLAEAIFIDKVNKRGLEAHFEIDSCGTAGYHIGEPPDPRTIQVAKKNGIAINHRGRQLAADDLAHFDFILAMDKSNYFSILRLDLDSKFSDKVHLMRDFDSEDGDEVPDPYYGGESGFQHVFTILERSIEGFLSQQNLKGQD